MTNTTIGARAQARGHDWQATLEGLVDTHGLQGVLEGLAEICHAKAAHIAENWQDTHTAKVWDKAGTLLTSTAAWAGTPRRSL